MSTPRRKSSAERDFFAGRDDELTVLRSLVTVLAGGVGGAVLVDGEQGVGKSALLRRVLGDAGETGFRLAWGTSDELGQQIPLLLIRECLGGARLVRSDAVGATRGPGAVGYRMAVDGPIPSGDPVLAEMERLIAEVERLCAESPVVLVTEDLQWADEASLLMWQRLARDVAQLPLLLVGTYRPVPAREEVDRLPAEHLPELVAHVVGARPGPRLADQVRAAGGNPLYVRELVDALVREGKVTVDAGVAELAATSAQARVPASLGAVIAERLSALPAEMVTVLRWAAVLGQEFQLAHLETVTGRSTVSLTGVLDLAVATGVVTEVGTKLAFRHRLIRQQLYEGVPPARLLHSQAARALAEAGAPMEQVAAQLALAADASAEWVREWLASALPVLAYRMPQVASQLLRSVIATMPDSDPRWEGLQAGLVKVAFLLGQYDEVQQAGRTLLAHTRDQDRGAEVAWLMAYSLLRAGKPGEAITALEGAVTRPGVSEMWSGRLCALQALMLSMTRRPDEAAEVADRVLADEDRIADPFATGYALHALSQVSFVGRDLATALNRIDRALAVIGESDQTTDLRLMLLANRVAALGLLDRQDEALGAARQALVVAERAGTSRLTVLRCTLAYRHFEAGQWDDALAELEPAVGQDLGVGSSLAHGLIALIAGYRDHGNAAEKNLDAVSEQRVSAAASASNSHYLHLARAVAAERAGRPDAAVGVLAACLAPGAATSMPARHLLLPVLVRLALAVGDADTAGAATQAAADEAEREPLPVKGAVAGHCRGLLTADPVPVLAAADYHGSAGRPLRRAEALTDAAALLASRGDTPSAREAFNEAIGLYRGLGAQWAIRSASARLSGYGIRPRQHGHRARPAHGWESLTPTEAKIARLVADGRSNPEIAAEQVLSLGTVRIHVSRILTKFGARSRMEFASSVARGQERLSRSSAYSKGRRPAAASRPDLYAKRHGREHGQAGQRHREGGRVGREHLGSRQGAGPGGYRRRDDGGQHLEDHHPRPLSLAQAHSCKTSERRSPFRGAERELEEHDGEAEDRGDHDSEREQRERPVLQRPAAQCRKYVGTEGGDSVRQRVPQHRGKACPVDGPAG
jgi:DNA-binding CsgD family transcriptional regulator